MVYSPVRYSRVFCHCCPIYRQVTLCLTQVPISCCWLPGNCTLKAALSFLFLLSSDTPWHNWMRLNMTTCLFLRGTVLTKFLIILGSNTFLLSFVLSRMSRPVWTRCQTDLLSWPQSKPVPSHPWGLRSPQRWLHPRPQSDLLPHWPPAPLSGWLVRSSPSFWACPCDWSVL